MHGSFDGAKFNRTSTLRTIESNLCGRQWDGYALDSVCLVIKRELHVVILSDEWRSIGAENRFTLVHKAEKDIYTIILN
jgi:hypothetical protein